MNHVFVSKEIPEEGITILKEGGCEVTIHSHEGMLPKDELIRSLTEKPYVGIISLLTDTIDAEVFDAAPSLKVCANYAVGFNNIDLEAAKKRGVVITNTPGTLSQTVAEHTVALALALASRVVEGDRFVRAGNFKGWEPMLLLGTDLRGKTLGLVGAGRIGAIVAEILCRGFGMHLIYTDIARAPLLEEAHSAVFYETVDELLPHADVVSLHTPLTDATHHLINADRLSRMKPAALLINTSRGPVIDEAALVEALKQGVIAGAALDVFEHEPSLAPGLVELSNVILTPHIASATEAVRREMACIAARNVVAVLRGESPESPVSA